MAQAHYEAAPSKTDLGRLRRLAFSLVHWSRPLGASRLGLPTTLKGNGMAFAWAVVNDGMPGSGVTEDAAATLDLAAKGLTVTFVPHASVSGLMAEQYAEASTQDERWEGGRAALLPRALVLTVRLVAKGNLRPAAAAAEVASPPLTLAAAGAGIAAGMGLLGYGSRLLGRLALGSLVTYVGLGLAAARASKDDLSALASAPRFVLHKLAAYARLARRRPGSWERTERG